VQNNFVPAALNNVHVCFFGSTLPTTEGRITARTANQVNVFVPYGVSPLTSVQVFVDVDGVTSAAVTVPVAPSAFGLSTADSSGTGQGAILNQDGTYNSHSNPAARGSIVTMFGTGEGVTTPALPDGALEISTPYSTTQAPVVVKFGGETATIQYDGAAPYLPTGVFQINATVPEGVTPGDEPITVSIGGIGTTRTVTVAVQ
jgi:trimeric autotransporter adhesin